MAVAITIDELSEELRRRREADGLTLRDVEAATGISAATLSRIERGSTPDFDIVKKLAKWLDVVVGTEEAGIGTPKTDAELKRTIEVHLRADKNLSAKLARSIADAFDLVMRVEIEKAKKKTR